MTRKQVYDFIKAGADSLKAQHEFRRGRVSEFSSLNKDFPVVWYETQIDTAAPSTDLNLNSLPIDAWPIKLWIGKLDRDGSLPEEYESIVDDCDEIAQTLAFKYNSVVAGNNLLTLTDINRTPFIKKLASCVTGVILSFNLNGPDTTDQSDNCD